jgi:chromosomal replication initiation ATPase DnaA
VRREEYLARRRKRRTDPTTSPLRRRALRFAQLVGDEFDVATDDMLSQLRYRELALPRMVLFWLCRESTSPQWSYPGIGHALARDHTTVMSACRKVRQLRESDLDMRDRLDRLSAAVEAVEKGKG